MPFRRVDRVLLAIVERDLDVDEGVTGDYALLHRLEDALLDRRYVRLRHHTADDLVLELEAATRGKGSSFSATRAYWPWPPVCFLCVYSEVLAAVIVSLYGLWA